MLITAFESWFRPEGHQDFIFNLWTRFHLEFVNQFVNKSLICKQNPFNKHYQRLRNVFWKKVPSSIPWKITGDGGTGTDRVISKTTFFQMTSLRNWIQITFVSIQSFPQKMCYKKKFIKIFLAEPRERYFFTLWTALQVTITSTPLIRPVILKNTS